ncbi:hypothetical protein PC119_g26223 [Phytophthora cactorum]|nr:hypothetical protein PC119_g26223 [Phytophthora cactorum]
MVHLAPVPEKVTGKHAAWLFVDDVFHHRGFPETFVSDRDPRFTAAFWQTLFQLLGMRLHMSTADHPQTDGQTERVNRVLEDTLRSVCAAAPHTWSERLPVVEFALNNAVHASTGFTPFYLNGMRHPQVPLTLCGGTESSILSGGEDRKALSSQVSDLRPVSLRKQGPAAPQTPQASREEEDPTPRNENQPQTSSNVQRRKAKFHAALVDREASGTPEGLRAITKGAPDLLKLAKSLIHIGQGRPATNPIMEFQDRPAQLVQAVLKLREDSAIPLAWAAASPPVPRPIAISRTRTR